MRALTGHEVEPTLTMREARAGDRYLLCSDGLSDPVSDETILEALQIPDVAESAYRLIELALRGGGPDNVTVVVADVVDYDYGQTQPILAGAVSGDDDQLTLPNTSAGRASAIQPARRVRQTCCAATGNAAPSRAGRGAGCSSPSRWSVLLVLGRPRRRTVDHPQQLLRRRIQRHGLHRARNPGHPAGHPAAGALSGGLPQRPQRAVPDQLRAIRRPRQTAS